MSRRAFWELASCLDCVNTCHRFLHPVFLFTGCPQATIKDLSLLRLVAWPNRAFRRQWGRDWMALYTTLKTRLQREMAKCDYCNSTIVIGGVKQGDQRFCNQKCYQSGLLLNVARQIPEDLLRREIHQVHQGQCPKCKGSGPIDVHTSYLVFSALILTRWSTKPQVSCRSCGVKSQLGNALISLLFGWWGFPWGLILTPVQVTRNLLGIFNPPSPTQPSQQLEKFVGLGMATQTVAQNQ